MQLGVALPHFGSSANAEAIVAVARKAEALGFASLWALDRLLWPIHPASSYPGAPHGAMPKPMQSSYDPLVVLGFAAAHTERLLLGTSVLVAGYRSPVVLAKMAATLDHLSCGRFVLGLGAGWNADEFVAVGQDIADRNERTDEFLEVVKELWQAAEPCFEGRYYRVPRSIFLPKPAQSGGCPIWIGGNSARAQRRAATYGDAWHPTSRMPVAEMRESMARIRESARQRGRDPEKIGLTLRWNNFPDITAADNLSAVAQRLRDYRDAGVEHVCIDFNIPQPASLSYMIESMERLALETAAL